MSQRCLQCELLTVVPLDAHTTGVCFEEVSSLGKLRDGQPSFADMADREESVRRSKIRELREANDLRLWTMMFAPTQQAMRLDPALYASTVIFIPGFSIPQNKSQWTTLCNVSGLKNRTIQALEVMEASKCTNPQYIILATRARKARMVLKNLDKYGLKEAKRKVDKMLKGSTKH